MHKCSRTGEMRNKTARRWFLMLLVHAVENNLDKTDCCNLNEWKTLRTIIIVKWVHLFFDDTMRECFKWIALK